MTGPLTKGVVINYCSKWPKTKETSRELLEMSPVSSGRPWTTQRAPIHYFHLRTPLGRTSISCEFDNRNKTSVLFSVAHCCLIVCHLYKPFSVNVLERYTHFKKGKQLVATHAILIHTWWTHFPDVIPICLCFLTSVIVALLSSFCCSTAVLPRRKHITFIYHWQLQCLCGFCCPGCVHYHRSLPPTHPLLYN